MTTVVRTVVLAALAALLLAEVAQAGRATVAGTRLVYTDAAAEANDITLSAQDGALVLVETGDGVVPVAGEGCTVSGSTVTCRTADGRPFGAASIGLGDGANRATVAASVELPVTLTGGDGPDVLRGGAGNDRIVGGDGDDLIEGDAGDDVLFGDEGADQLQGDGGLDDFSGDAGDDVLRAADGVAEVLDCGAGADRAEADASDQANADCEMPGAAQVLPGPPPDESFEEEPAPGPLAVDGGTVRSLRVRSRCFFPWSPVSRTRRTTCRRPTRGSALLVETTKPTAVVVGIQRVLTGTRLGTGCFPLAGGGPNCVRYVRAALLRRTVPAGTTALGLTARAPAPLAPGLYRAALSAEAGGRPVGRALFAFFRVVPGSKHRPSASKGARSAARPLRRR